MASSLLAELGLVCARCAVYNEPASTTCGECGAPLTSGNHAAAPAAAPKPAAAASAAPPRLAPAAPAPTPAPRPAAAATGAPVLRPVATPQAPRATPAPAPSHPSVRPSVPVEARQATLRPDQPHPQPLAPAPKPVPAAAPAVRAAPTAVGVQPGRPAPSAPRAAPPAAARPAAQPAARPAGAAAVPLSPLRLTVVRGSSPGASFRLPAAPAAAGTAKGTLAFPDDPYLAPVHATFYIRESKLFVRDERSASGTYVRVRAPEPIGAGTLFAAGDRLLRFLGPLGTPASTTPMPYGAPTPAVTLFGVEEIFEGGRPGRTCVRSGPSISIGRGGCDLSFPLDTHLSQKHCEVAVDHSAAVLKDLGSGDGTFVRLPAGGERALAPGDCIRIGRQILRVELA